MPCYFDTEDCKGELWQCKTCGESYCKTHFHLTAIGRNMQCAACEYNADDYARDLISSAALAEEIMSIDELEQYANEVNNG